VPAGLRGTGMAYDFTSQMARGGRRHTVASTASAQLRGRIIKNNLSQHPSTNVNGSIATSLSSSVQSSS
jgi:hypothetical protein